MSDGTTKSIGICVGHPHELGDLSLSDIEQAVDADIAKFDQHFQDNLQNAPLLPAEKAIIKTYLAYHLLK